MNKCNFKAYEGKEKYIFVSYAHKDADRVYPILDILAEKGYRVWYDDGIIPGSEWPEFIAKHLSDCDIVMFFVSPDAAASENCRREINFALSRQKKLISVFLEETQLTPGMELQISTTQSLYKHRYENEDQFFERLFSTPMLENCRQTISDAADESDAEFTEADGEAEEEKADEVLPAEQVPEKKKGAGGVFHTLSLKVIIIIAAALILVCGVVLLLSDSDDDGFYESEYDEYEFTAENVDITPEMTEKYGKVTELQKISLKNCTFTDGAGLDNLNGIDSVVYLYMDNCKGINDFSFISKAKSLEVLCIKNMDGFTGMKAASFPNLYEVNFSGSAVTDITALEGIASLTGINCDGCTGLVLPGHFEGALESVSFENCGIDDFSCLEGQSSLRNVNLNNNPVSDISFLNGSKYNLSVLYLNDTALEAEDLAIMKDVDLRILAVNGIQMKDMSLIASMNSLEELYMSGCGLESCEEGNLAGKEDLSKIYLNNNCLEKMPVTGNDNISVFDVSGNMITDILNVPNTSYGWFICYNNPIDWESIAGKPDFCEKIDGLAIGSAAEYLSTVPNDIMWNKVYIVDCEKTEEEQTASILDEKGIDFEFVSYDRMEHILSEDSEYRFESSIDFYDE